MFYVLIERKKCGVLIFILYRLVVDDVYMFVCIENEVIILRWVIFGCVIKYFFFD